MEAAVSIFQEVALKVGVAVTQSTEKEGNKKYLTVKEDANNVVYAPDEKENSVFSFDSIGSQNDMQETLYPDLLQPLVQRVLSGFNGNILIGGAFQSGKEEMLQGSGIVNQLIEDLFSEINKTSDGECLTTVSFLQFYPDDTPVDLLNRQNQDLSPVTHPVLGLVVEEACEIVVQTPEQACRLYQETRAMQKATTGNLISRCSSVFSVHVEKRLQNGSESPEFCRSRLQLFDLAGGAYREDVNGVSPLLKVLEQAEGLLPVLLTEALRGNGYTVLIYCIKARGLVDEETPRALALAQQLRRLRTRVSPGHWCPQRSAHRLRSLILQQRNKIIAQENSGEQETRELAELVKALQIVKNQSWEKKRERSKENEEKIKAYAASSPAYTAPQLREMQERLRYFQEQLKKEMEEHLKDGKVCVDKNQKSVSRIEQLKEAIAEEERKLKNVMQESEQLQHPTGQAKDTLSQAADVELEYTTALNRRRRLKEQHSALIQEELLKMEQEQETEKGEGQVAELWRLGREREILVLQLESLRREKAEAERDLEAQHHRHTQELATLRAESLQVFRAFREVFEEQRETLEQRYRGLLVEAIRDAVYLSAKNQQLEVENSQLQKALEELRDSLCVKRDHRGTQHHQQDAA